MVWKIERFIHPRKSVVLGDHIFPWLNKSSHLPHYHAINIYPPLLSTTLTLRLGDLPSVSLAFPPVGWHSTVEHPTHKTTVWAWLKTVVIL